jgi:hypothetical protein
MYRIQIIIGSDLVQLQNTICVCRDLSYEISIFHAQRPSPYILMVGETAISWISSLTLLQMENYISHKKLHPFVHSNLQRYSRRKYFNNLRRESKILSLRIYK